MMVVADRRYHTIQHDARTNTKVFGQALQTIKICTSDGHEKKTIRPRERHRDIAKSPPRAAVPSSPRTPRMTMACGFTNFCMNFCAQVESVAPPKSTGCSPWHRPLDPTPSKRDHDENDINTHASEKRRMRRRLKRGILRSRDSNCHFACVPTCTSMDSEK